MEFRCNIAPNAVPCVSITTHDQHGNKLDRPTKRYSVVKKGKSVSWVDRCSRKHFTAADKEARELNAKDFKAMKLELEGLGVKDLPDDVTFAECADSLAKIYASREKVRSGAVQRVFAPAEEAAVVELTNKELRALLNEKDIAYGPQDNKATLKALLEA